MNILYLKYAVEVARTGSINKAAEYLYVAQPNVSRAIKELEASLGITIFERTTKGMLLTQDGERLMRYAKSILSQIDEVESIFKSGESKKKKFSVSVPRASYISYAFAQFVKNIPSDSAVEFFYKETNALRTINNILNADYKLGIIRYAEKHDKQFKEMLEEKGLLCEVLAEFRPVLLMSEKHKLALLDNITRADLRPFTEVAHSDPYVPSMPIYDVKKEELFDDTDRKIFVFERASQLEILSKNEETFMWGSPVPEDLRAKYGLVEKACEGREKIYRDVIIYRKNYRMTSLDKMFVTELCNAKRKFIDSAIR